MNDPMGDSPVIQRAPRKPKKKAKKRGVAARQHATAEAPLTRNSPRPAPPRAESNRDPARDPARRNARIAIGRGGEELTRRRITIGTTLRFRRTRFPPAGPTSGTPSRC